MIALLWLIIALLLGDLIGSRLAGRWPDLLRRSGFKRGARLICANPWLLLPLRWTAAFGVGTLVLTWVTYLLALFAATALSTASHPLILANAMTMVMASGLILLTQVRAWYRRPRSLPRSLVPVTWHDWLMPALAILTFVLLSSALMFGTFSRSGSSLEAGMSVFSDFSPHTALVSSFSRGRNWPTEYPHFAHDGIRYHFLFYFMCGNLEFLGLPMDWAINLPSLLGMVGFLILLGIWAVLISGRRASFCLAPALALFRSSFAFFSFLEQLSRQLEPGAAIAQYIRRLLNQQQFIGITRHDDWGLWTINVFANQRHLLPGLCLVLIVLLLFLPDLASPSRGWLLRRESGLYPAPEIRRGALILLLMALLPFWHGSALVILLLMIGWWCLFSRRRLLAAAALLTGIGSAWLQSSLFAGTVSGVVQPQFLFGFIADDLSVWGIIRYLLLVLGLTLPLLGVAFFWPGRRRIILAGLLLPTGFAFTVSLTPDVTVNHKYMMFTALLGSVFIADLLIRLWRIDRPRTTKARSVGPMIARRTLAVLLGTILMITGVQEWIIERNINDRKMSIKLDDPLTLWIESHTDPKAVFVAAPWHYHAFFLSGRKLWYGHAYYAWSAGHDTESREASQRWLLTGCGRDLEATRQLITRSRLDYLIIDDTLRHHEDLWVDEAFFDAHFPVVQRFPEQSQIKIYDLTTMRTS